MTPRLLRPLLLLAALALPVAANADGEPGAACASCHDAGAAGPWLGGQGSTYLAKQLQDLRDGARAHGEGSAATATLGTADIAALASRFAALPPRPAAGGADPDVVAAGRRLARAGDCGTCHQPGFTGMGVNARLAGLGSGYLATQLRALRDGTRSNDHGLHRTLLRRRTDAELETLARFFSSL